MSFDWTDYLNLALHLHGQPQGYGQEAAQRSAASRAYYAAFCHARNYARDRQGFRPRYNVDDHKNVRAHFRRRQMPRIARKLDSLRQWRNDCDYSDTVPNITDLVTSAIAEAQQVLRKLT